MTESNFEARTEYRITFQRINQDKFLLTIDPGDGNSSISEWILAADGSLEIQLDIHAIACGKTKELSIRPLIKAMDAWLADLSS